MKYMTYLVFAVLIAFALIYLCGNLPVGDQITQSSGMSPIHWVVSAIIIIFCLFAASASNNTPEQK